MNVETMQQLLNVFAAIGADAKTAFIWWMIADKVLPSLLCTGIFVALCATIYRTIRYLYPTPTEKQVFMEVRDRYTIGTPGYLSDEEIQRVARKIRELVANDKGSVK